MVEIVKMEHAWMVSATSYVFAMPSGVGVVAVVLEVRDGWRADDVSLDVSPLGGLEFFDLSGVVQREFPVNLFDSWLTTLCSKPLLPCALQLSSSTTASITATPSTVSIGRSRISTIGHVVL